MQSTLGARLAAILDVCSMKPIGSWAGNQQHQMNFEPQSKLPWKRMKRAGLSTGNIARLMVISIIVALPSSDSQPQLLQGLTLLSFFTFLGSSSGLSFGYSQSSLSVALNVPKLGLKHFLAKAFCGGALVITGLLGRNTQR